MEPARAIREDAPLGNPPNQSPLAPGGLPDPSFPPPPNPNDVLIRVIIPEAIYEGRNESIGFELSRPAPYNITINFRLAQLSGSASVTSDDFTYFSAVTVLKGQQNAFLADALRPIDERKTEYTERFKLFLSADQPVTGTIYLAPGYNENFSTVVHKIFDVKDVVLRPLVDPSIISDVASQITSRTEDLAQYLHALENTSYGDVQYSATLQKIGSYAKYAGYVVDTVTMANRHRESYERAAAELDPIKAANIRYDADKLLFVDFMDKFAQIGFATGTAAGVAALIATGTAPLAVAALTTLAVGLQDAFVYSSIQGNVRVGLAEYYDEQNSVELPPQGAVKSMDIEGLPGQAYRLYEAAFNRDPDYEGLGHWIKAMQANKADLAEVARHFIASSEFSAKYGASQTVTNEKFVTLLYNNVLDRNPDAEGLSHWAGSLVKGASREQILIGFSESLENKNSLAAEVADGIFFL